MPSLIEPCWSSACISAEWSDKSFGAHSRKADAASSQHCVGRARGQRRLSRARPLSPLRGIPAHLSPRGSRSTRQIDCRPNTLEQDRRALAASKRPAPIACESSRHAMGANFTASGLDASPVNIAFFNCSIIATSSFSFVFHSSSLMSSSFSFDASTVASP